MSLNEDALKAAIRTGSRIYELTGLNNKRVNFLVTGCHGYYGLQPQENVAHLMDKMAGEDPIDFILFLGDNIYNHGVKSPDDEGFDTCFYNVYPKYKNLKNIPSFSILGNHDENRHKGNPLGLFPSGLEVGMHQVAHSYLPAGIKYPTVDAKEKLYAKEQLPLADLPPWNMPAPFYSLIAGDAQIFCINSNTYAEDYLNYKLGKANKNNQAKWLEEEIAKAKNNGKKIILASHHSLATAGKRAFPHSYDTSQYINENQIKSLQEELKTDTKSYNELLNAILIKQGIKQKVDLALAAHDHFLSHHYEEKNENNNVQPNAYCQVTAGGGGGKLQTRESFAGHPYVAAHIQKNGAVKVSYDKDNTDVIDIEYRAISADANDIQPEVCLKFNNKSPKAKRDLKNVGPDVEKLRIKILDYCNEYLEKMKKIELENKSKNEGMLGRMTNYLYTYVSPLVNYIYKNNDVSVDDIINYLNQYTPDDLEKTIASLQNLIVPFSGKEKMDDSFKKIKEVIDTAKLKNACRNLLLDPDLKNNHPSFLNFSYAKPNDSFIKQINDYLNQELNDKFEIALSDLFKIASYSTSYSHRLNKYIKNEFEGKTLSVLNEEQELLRKESFKTATPILN